MRPPLSIEERGPGRAIAVAVPTSTTTGMVRMLRATSFISAGRIRLRKVYSGVRPTMRPATNTERIASTSRP